MADQHYKPPRRVPVCTCQYHDEEPPTRSVDIESRARRVVRDVVWTIIESYHPSSWVGKGTCDRIPYATLLAVLIFSPLQPKMSPTTTAQCEEHRGQSGREQRINLLTDADERIPFTPFLPSVPPTSPLSRLRCIAAKPTSISRRDFDDSYDDGHGDSAIRQWYGGSIANGYVQNHHCYYSRFCSNTLPGMVVLWTRHGADDAPGQYARPIAHIAATLGVPPILITLRHQATHEDLPPLPLLVHSVQLAIDYLHHQAFLPILSSPEHPGSSNGQRWNYDETRAEGVVGSWKHTMKTRQREKEVGEENETGKELKKCKKMMEGVGVDAMVSMLCRPGGLVPVAKV